MDWYLGIKPVTGRITWDLGVIDYSYPNALNRGSGSQLLRAQSRRQRRGLEGRNVRRDGVLVARLPAGVGSTWTVETSFTQVFPKFKALHREWTPSFSALLGWQGNEARRATSSRTAIATTTTSTERRLLARLPRAVVDRLQVLGHELEQQFRWQRLLHGPHLPVRRAVRGNFEVHLLNREERRISFGAPASGALCFCASRDCSSGLSGPRSSAQAARGMERAVICSCPSGGSTEARWVPRRRDVLPSSASYRPVPVIRGIAGQDEAEHSGAKIEDAGRLRSRIDQVSIERRPRQR